MKQWTPKYQEAYTKADFWGFFPFQFIVDILFLGIFLNSHWDFPCAYTFVPKYTYLEWKVFWPYV